MWYLILFLLSSLVDYANRCPEECFSKGRAGGIGDKFMESRGGGDKLLEPPLQASAEVKPGRTLG
jgi:hypothetical protein